MEEAGNGEQTVDQDHQEIATEKEEVLDKWLLALKEDLASWISRLLNIELTVDSFTSVLYTGVVPCKLANFIQNTGDQFFINNPGRVQEGVFPPCGVTFKERGASQGSFIARDNVCNFILWCRELGVPDVIMFETEDLVSNKNEKAVLLTLLEVARRVFKFGIDPPELVRLENEIDKELENESKPTPPIKIEKLTSLKKKHKSHSLDDLVFEVQKKCKCSSRYPVQRISDGKYRMGDSKNLIFVRVMRKHVMVRVGGGWDTLDRYFEKHDPCRLVAQRKTSKASRPSSASQTHELFVRSPSSMSQASVSSTDSYDSTSTAYSHMSVSSTPPPSQAVTKHGHSPRHRTLSVGTSSPTFDRCLSPRRESRARHKSPCQRSTPPRTIETQGILSKKSISMQDLQRRGSDSSGVSIIHTTTKPRPSSARSQSATPAANVSTAKSPRGAPPGQRRKSVAVSPKKDSPGAAVRQRKQSMTHTSSCDTSQSKMHNRSRSMQDLNKYNLTGPFENSRSRPTTARGARSTTGSTDRSSNLASQRKTSTTQATLKTPSNTSCDGPRRRTSAQANPVNSPRTPVRSSSTPRGTSNSPASSPRISRRQSSTPSSSVYVGTTVNSPGTMRRAISNLSSSSATSYRIKRSASFDLKEKTSPQALNTTAKGQTVGSNRDASKLSSKTTSSTGVKNPTKQARVPIKIPGKQAKVKPPGQRAPTKPRSMTRDKPKAIQNGFHDDSQNNRVSESHADPHTPFDDYTYTSAEKAMFASDEDYIPLAENLDFPGDFGQTKPSKSGSSTPDTVKTIELFLGGNLENSTSDYDYPDCESDDISGLKSPRSINSGFSISPSPTKQLLESHETEGAANIGIMQRLQSLNVEQSSVRPILRGKIFTPIETDDLDAGESANSSVRQESLKLPSSFSIVEYSTKEPEERSKFFDIEKERPVEFSNGHQSVDQLDSPRKFSLVHALIGSIEKRNSPNRNIGGKKKPDTSQEKAANIGNTIPVVCELSTEPRTGDEAMTGSCGTAQEPGLVYAKPPSNIESSASLEIGQQLDENDNLPKLESLSNGTKYQLEELEELKRLEQVEQYFDEETTGSAKHDELVNDENTQATQRQLSLEEMIQDMQPGNRPK